jgi:FAD/FMN-containing dehydrogenase
MGIATRIAVRLTPDPPAVRTLLLDFMSIDDAAAAVSGIIAAGIVPAALEMMDAEITRAVEDYVGAGFPRDAAAVLLVEVDGLAGGVAHQVAAVERCVDGVERVVVAPELAGLVGDASRRSARLPHRPRLLPTRRRCACAWSTCSARCTPRRPAAAHDDERVPCGRWEPTR